MFYHVSILTKDQQKRDASPIVKIDIQQRSEVFNDIIVPYINNAEFIFEGVPMVKSEIARLIVMESDISARKWVEHREAEMPDGLIWTFTPHDITEYRDFPIITNKLIKEARDNICTSSETSIAAAQTPMHFDDRKVFIVHGHDSAMKHEVARFIELLGLEAIILDEQVNRGQTIIEKIEENASVCFAVVLYSPCDVGGKDKDNLEPRARQNVVFEHGFMIGKLGRDKVCAIIKGTIEKPTDIAGIVYIQMEGDWKLQLARELKNARLDVDLNRLTAY